MDSTVIRAHVCVAGAAESEAAAEALGRSRGGPEGQNQSYHRSTNHNWQAPLILEHFLSKQTGTLLRTTSRRPFR
jgi:hypothetical protein